MKLKDNSTQEIDTALYQLEQRLSSKIRTTNTDTGEKVSSVSAKIDTVDKKLTQEVKDRQSADRQLQDNINTEATNRQNADAAIENAKQDKLVAGDNIKINGNVISATAASYSAEAPIKVSDNRISLDTVPVSKGGTGATTASEGFKALADGLVVYDGTIYDDETFPRQNRAGTTWQKYKFSKLWEYIKGKISSVLGLTADNYNGTAATILDYNKKTSIRIRWGGGGISSADWYPAFNADGSAIEPINRTNIHAGLADKIRTSSPSSPANGDIWIE